MKDDDDDENKGLLFCAAIRDCCAAAAVTGRERARGVATAARRKRDSLSLAQARTQPPKYCLQTPPTLHPLFALVTPRLVYRRASKSVHISPMAARAFILSALCCALLLAARAHASGSHGGKGSSKGDGFYLPTKSNSAWKLYRCASRPRRRRHARARAAAAREAHLLPVESRSRQPNGPLA
jgi:hypothetical protein